MTYHHTRYTKLTKGSYGEDQRRNAGYPDKNNKK